MSFSLREYITQTSVSAVGARILTELTAWLGFLADLTQKNILFFVPDAEKTAVIVTEKAAPAVGVAIDFGQVGEKFPLKYEQILTGVLRTGRPISGRREVELGVSLSFDVYPVLDNAGLVLALIAFVGSPDNTPQLLLDSAWRLLGLPYPTDATEQMNVSTQDGILLYNPAGRVVYMNEIGQRLLHLWEVSQPNTALRMSDSLVMAPVEQARTEKAIVTAEWELPQAVLAARALPIPAEGTVAGVLLLLTDVTMLRQKEKEIFVKDVVIQEIHHRVKNNLQTVASLLRMQERRSGEETKAALKEAERRILAIASIHDTLAAQVEDEVDIALLIEGLIQQLRLEWAPAVEITWEAAGTWGTVTSKDALTIGMTVHELVQNACEHGKGESKQQQVNVRLYGDTDGLRLTIQNFGPPLPPDFSPDRYRLGLQIVANLVKFHLGGTFVMQNEKNSVLAICQFPRKEEK